MLTHFAAYDADRKTWCAAYRRPSDGSTVPLVIGCGSEAVAQQEADRLNIEQMLRHTPPMPAPREREFRPIRGFYTDKEDL